MTDCIKIYTDVNYHGEYGQSQENHWTGKFVLHIAFFVCVSRQNEYPIVRSFSREFLTDDSCSFAAKDESNLILP